MGNPAVVSSLAVSKLGVAGRAATEMLCGLAG
jgi:hypothetical protein